MYTQLCATLIVISTWTDALLQLFARCLRDKEKIFGDSVYDRWFRHGGVADDVIMRRLVLNESQ